MYTTELARARAAELKGAAPRQRTTGRARRAAARWIPRGRRNS